MVNVLEVSSDTNIGGAGKCILTYLKYYDRAKFNVAVVLPKDSLLKPMAEALGAKVFEIDAMADKSFDVGAIKKLMKVYKEFRPDIVHTHASMAARIAAKLYGCSVVYTRHSVFPPNKKLTHGIGKAASGLINNLTADSVIAVAEAAKDNITQIGVSERKISVVLNGVEPLQSYSDEEKAAIKAKYGIGEKTKCAAIVARLNSVKGHKYFVDAARQLREKGVDFKLLIAGTGEEEAAIRDQIKSCNLENEVLMLGFLDNVEPLMNIIDVQANCSFGTEATSLSLLEGMSLGKPAVVTDFGGNPGVISNGVNGFIIPTHNSQLLAERLCELFTNADIYEKMRQNSLKIFNEKFTAKKYAENIEKVYINALKGGKGRINNEK